MRPLAFAIPTAILAVLAVATPAYANPSQASASCEGGVVYSGHDYPPAGNTVTIVIDGAIVKTSTFGTATSGTVGNPDKTKPHTWAVIWDRYNGTDGDRTQQGQIPACVAAAIPSTTAPTTTAAPVIEAVASSSVQVVTLETPAPAVVAVADPPVPQPQGVSAAFTQTLPATGSGTDLLTLGAAAVMVAGLVMVLVARRRVA